jgi:hypothetical protein
MLGTSLQTSEHSPPRKSYQSPSLVDWGSLVELTKGEGFDIGDENFNGSGGT